MNFDITPEQDMVRDTFARFLDANSTPQRVRAAMEDARAMAKAGVTRFESATALIDDLEKARQS